MSTVADPVELLKREGSGLLLDLDGTLVDSEPVHRAAFHAYFTARGWDVPDDVVRQFSGRRGVEVFASLDGPWRGEEPEALTTGVITAIEMAHAQPVRGAAQAIRHWRARGVPIAVVTSAGASWALAVLDLLGVAVLGLALARAEDTPVGKPDPAPFRLGARRLGVDIGRCVVAEDAPAGLTSARAAGAAHLIGMTTSYPAEVLLAAGADTTAADLTVLLP